MSVRTAPPFLAVCVPASTHLQTQSDGLWQPAGTCCSSALQRLLPPVPLTISCWCLWFFCCSGIWQSPSILHPLFELLQSPGCLGLCGRAAPLAGAHRPRCHCQGDTGGYLSPMLLLAEPFLPNPETGQTHGSWGILSGIDEGSFQLREGAFTSLSELTHPSTATHRYLPHSDAPESGPLWVICPQMEHIWTCPQIELSRMLQLPSASARLSLAGSENFSLGQSLPLVRAVQRTEF